MVGVTILVDSTTWCYLRVYITFMERHPGVWGTQCPVPTVHALMTWGGVRPKQRCHHLGAPHHTKIEALEIHKVKAKVASEARHHEEYNLGQGTLQILSHSQLPGTPIVRQLDQRRVIGLIWVAGSRETAIANPLPPICASSCTAATRLAQSMACVAHFAVQVHTSGGQ